jgi:hypothetical protein
VFSYVAMQLPFLVLVNSVVIFWGLAFPFSYRKQVMTGETWRVHLAIVLTALILPLPFAGVHLKDGFVGVEYPTTVCLGRNIDINYISFILPQSIMICISTILLILIFWTIFKV